MRVEDFRERYELVASVYGITAAELRDRDNARGWPVRWVAIEGGKAVGAATTATRPDTRTFVQFAGDVAQVARPLTEAVTAHVAGKLHASVSPADVDAAAALAGAGFEVEVETERFEVSFAPALRLVDRVTDPAGVTFLDVRDADPDLLYDLDIAIRQDVPGTDGWRGNRDWFDAELEDPASYWVAADDDMGTYVGLARMWRNEDELNLGLLGVRRKWRGTRIAPALLRRILEESSQWGRDAFTTATSPSNRAIYPKLVRLGARSLGRSNQLVRPG